MTTMYSIASGAFSDSLNMAVSSGVTVALSNVLFDVRVNETALLNLPTDYFDYEVPALAVMAVSGALAHVGGEIATRVTTGKSLNDNLMSKNLMGAGAYTLASASVFTGAVNMIAQVEGASVMDSVVKPMMLGGLVASVTLMASMYMTANTSWKKEDKTSEFGSEDDNVVFF